MINILRGKQTVLEEKKLISQTIIQLFEQQVFYNPERVAIRYLGEEVTYAQLNERANYLGDKLRKFGVQANDVVAILSKQNLDMIVAIIGVLKSGAAYLPIALDTPINRIKYILEDSQSKIVLTNSKDDLIKENLNIPFVTIDQEKTLKDNLPIINTPNDLLYVIYTSGTTGNPKGVMIENRNLANTINWRIQTGSVTNQSVFLQKSAYVFDVSVGEIFSTLLAGAELQLLSEEQNNNFEELVSVIYESKVTHISIVSTFFFELLEYLKENNTAWKLDSLKTIYLGGDSVTLSLLNKYREVMTSDPNFSKLFNEYGPTECTITATSCHLKDFSGNTMTIGKPISNTTVLILNDEGEQCQEDEIGELCIGGAGVSRGYLNHQELTAEKFIENPFKQGEKLYRSGDLAKYASDGNIIFLGRMDDQVKIRGYRIELDEIKDALCELPEIDSAAVSIWEKDGSQHLCGYVVFSKDRQLTRQQINKRLSTRLSSYMIPTFIVPIDKIPLTVNGKLDKRKLPAPEMAQSKEIVLPTTKEQEITVRVFKEILGINEVSINDSFFELGGDSIKAIRMISRFRKYDYSIDLPTIMESRYVETISEKIAQIVTTSDSYDEVTGDVLLTPIQKLFFKSKLNEPQHFNQSFLLESQERLQKEPLENAFQVLLSHHDMLRAVYPNDAQTILSLKESKTVPIEYFYFPDIEEDEEIKMQIEAASNQYQASLDLATGPLVKALCFSTKRRDFLLVIIHHLVVDGISWRIIVEDLNTSYLAAKEQQEIILPAKTDSFQKWCELLAQYGKSYRVQQELPLWEETVKSIEKSRISDVELDSIPSELKLKTLHFDADITNNLLYEAGKSYNLEINDLLLTALFRTVNKLASSSTVSVQLEGHGREIIDQGESIDRTVGWFTIMYPITVNNIGRSLATDLKNTKETLRRIPKHGIGYGVLCEQYPHLEQDQAEITFNYLGVFNEEADSDLIKIDTVEFGNQVSSKNRFGTKINMDSSVSNGELILNISYDAAFFSEELVMALQETYYSELLAVVEHCLSVNETEYSASDFGELEWSQQEFDRVNLEIIQKKDRIQKIFPLTTMQEGMLFHKLIDEASTSYVVQNNFKIDGTIDYNSLVDSLDILAKKHRILRAMIKYKGVKEPRLVILENKQIESQYVDISADLQPDKQIEKLKEQDLARGFDLENDALFRIRFIKTSDNQSHLIMSFHHIILDGWCLGPLLSDLNDFYTKLSNGMTKEELIKQIPEDTSYEDYLKVMNLKDKEKALEYWTNLLADYSETATIIPEGNPIKSNEEVRLIQQVLTTQQYDKLKQFSQENGQTTSSVIESVWGTVLAAYNNTDDVVFGKVVSGRNVDVKDIESALGLFINTIPVRMKFEKHQAFIDVVKQLQKQSFESEKYDYCSLVEIQNENSLGQDLFQSIVVFENEYHSEEDSYLKFKPEGIREQTNYPITVSVVQGETLNLRISYDTEQYNQKEMVQVLTHFTNALLHVLEQPNKAMADISLMDSEEENIVLNRFNQTKVENKSITFIQAFNEQVKKTPNSPAIRIANETITYLELNEKANALGKQLRAKGVGRDSIVGILADRSLEMIIGMYGILKAGGAYLPIDPGNPIDRIEYTIKNSEALLLLVDAPNAELVKTIEVEQIVLTDIQRESEDLMVINQPNDLAYVIYTSGTTGMPKGVMVEHRNLVNSLNWHIKDSFIKNDSVILQKSSFAFDVSVAEIFTCGLTGACLQLLTTEENDNFSLLAGVIEKNQVTHFFMVSTLFTVFLDYLAEIDKKAVLSSLKHVYLGGDKMTLDMMSKLNDQYKEYSFTISNAYGPTECAIAATSYKMTSFVEEGILPIGKPIDNVKLYVMNDGKLCGIGMPGELFIGGAGVSRGYLNNETLTHKMFTENPYCEGERIYRTGDLVRWLGDGNIDILGRIDEQVKIRGFRIELGEIKTKLTEFPAITDAAVIIQEVNGSHLLNAFVVGEQLDVHAIKEQLKKLLPAYMVPDFIQEINEIPITRNGKLDKAKLPVPEIKQDKEIVLPQSPIEETIHRLFKEILNVEQVSIHNSFFDLGGHSLKAIRLAGAIEKELHAQLSIGEILEAQTIEQIAKKVQIKQKEYAGYQKLEKTDYTEMSSVQRRLYALNQLEPESILYNVPVIMKANGNIDKLDLQCALEKLIARHEPLRTVFSLENNQFLQTVLDNAHIDVLTEEIEVEEINDQINKFIQPFDLSKAPLFRAKVFYLSDNTSILALDFHHLIFDGGSLPYLLQDLSSYYGNEELIPLEYQYKDYCAYASKQELDEQEQFWLKEFEQGIERMNIPTDFSRPATQSFNGRTVNGKLDSKIKENVQLLSKQTNMTEYAIILAAFNLLLSRYCQTNDVIVGVPVSGRTHPDIQDMIGMFVNTLVLKNHVNEEETFESFVKDVQNRSLIAFEHQDYPYEELVKQLEPERDQSRNPLFDIMFAFEKEGDQAIQLGDLQLEELSIDGGISKFDLTLNIHERKDSYEMFWEYNTDLFTEITIQNIMNSFCTILATALNNTQMELNQIPSLSQKKQAEVYESLNDTKTKLPEQTLMELFEKTSMAKAKNKAISYGDTIMTYAEMNQASNRIAHKLKELGFGTKDHIGIEGHKNIETIIGILAILKVGGAYVPLDPKNPISRQEHIIQDSEIKIVLTSDEESPLNNLVEILGLDLAQFDYCPNENLEITANQEDTAYIIYTSGTTGLPKGVEVTHKNIIRLVKNTNLIEDTDLNILQTGSLAFDASTFEIWGSLLNGGSLTMIDQTTLFDTTLLSNVIKEAKIDAMFMTTSLFNQLVSEDVHVFDHLGMIIVGGEKLSEYHVQLLRDNNATIQIKNGYGPTETTTFALTYTVGETIPEPIPIGAPIGNTTAYVVYKDNLCTIGMPGELYIGGAGVSKGYLNQVELTAERFVSHPTFATDEDYLYRTGDLVKINADGLIDYLGRIDEQVKIRGYRIELSEISKQINELPNVLETLTIVNEASGTKEIVSYVVTDIELDKQLILEQLQETLPEYMIPKQIMLLNELPKTKNGKVDIKLLPKVERASSKDYIAPRSEKEKEITEIFKMILDIPKIGIDDGFFELGGDSIKAIRIVSKLRENQYQVSTKAIMELKTIRRISASIERSIQLNTSEQQVSGEGKFTPIQQEFFRERLPKPAHFNQSLLLESVAHFNEKSVKQSLDFLVAYHDNLRAVYKEDTFIIPESSQQDHCEYQAVTLPVDNEITTIEEIGNEAQKQFNIQSGPLFKAIHFKGLHKDYLLLIAHHLVIDGVSWRILFEDFTRCYEQVENNEEITLPAKTYSYLKWSETLEQYGESVLSAKEIRYWEEIEEKITEPIFARGSQKEELPLTTIELKFSKNLTEQLLKDAGQAYNTKTNDLVLTAFVTTIQKLFSRKDVTVNIEGHGREQLSQEIVTDRTVGWFTSIYPVVFDLSGDGLAENIKTVKETVRRVPNNGVGYGILKAYRQLFHKLPEFTFNYLGEIGEEGTMETSISISDQASFEEIDLLNKFGSPITLNALVRNKALEVALNFDPDYVSDSSLQNQFASIFEETLKEIITQCVAVKETEYTVSDFGELVWNDQEFKQMLFDQDRDIHNIERILPMTPMQQGMLYHKAVDSDSTSYVIQSEFQIHAIDFDSARLNEAFQLIAEKYSILRTNVVYRQVEEPRMILQKEKAIESHCIDLSLNQNPMVEYQRIVQDDVQRGFDLEKDSLLRTKIIELPNNEVRLVLTFHHIILDGWCVSILMNEINHFYTELSNGIVYSEIRSQLEIDDSFEQHVRKLNEEDSEAGLMYWQDLISDYDSTAEISADHTENQQNEPMILTEEKYVSKELSQKVKVAAQTLGVTINTMIETAWGILLQKYNYTNDVIFGKVVSGRNADIDGIENSLGLYINTILLRVDSTDKTIEELVKAIQKQALDSGKYDHCSLADIQNEYQASTDLIQTLFVFENYHTQEESDNQKAINLEMINAREETNYAITLSAQYTTELGFKLMYDSQKYETTTIVRLLNRLVSIIGELANDSRKLVSDIELFDHTDEEILLTVCNPKAVSYPSTQTIIELFEEQVRQRPDAIAVKYREQALTYRELDQQANHVARQLIEAGVEPEQPVGLLVSKKLEVIVGLFGILKANAVYVPLDPKNPMERNQYILTDSQCELVLTPESEPCEFIKSQKQMTVTLNNDLEAVVAPESCTTENSLAYIIYTSGTSGKPKGVMVEQHNVIRLVKNNTYAELAEANILQGGSLAFDASTFEIFGALLNGGSLFLAEEEQLSNPELLKETIINNEINCMFITTALFNQLVSADVQLFDHLDTVLVGGEKASEKHFALLREHNAQIKLSNIYGPTESTTFALVYPIEQQVPKKLPIGKPIANTTAYVLDGQARCGIDIPGELCLGGAGIARGYFNQPELTEEKFIQIPAVSNERLYRTGDLVKMNAAGDILFLGRIDHQVKIRGFRIELDEIMNQIRSMPEVHDAVVVIKELNDEKIICGFLTLENEDLELDVIHTYLEQKLPHYMIPSYLQILPELPLTKNGKIDISALPELEYVSTKEYSAPTTENEKILAEIFEKVLEVDQIGIDDNFFELGGHSLKIMNVVNLLEKEKNMTVSFRSIIDGKTVRKIAQDMDMNSKEYVPMELDDEEVF
ncbi:amino acid adenylation domain-containing protein [Enterococcus moraviensis ATCC BAA-383]|uniref:Amino acid adenylation domain-containing protein n=1 Tax=Enterococcus moraviensis ATCC BAA-383 TaxID=1158609 RepID=R2T6S0_9ENTE|nr:amino acid adenylation domain-containing protein [Enterococcus moraviensis ATCC BAA-383]EOT73022.1 hypothetical protein I586_00015 [Enterococcus moraviensis ATCC BAA-383]